MSFSTWLWRRTWLLLVLQAR